MRSCNVLREGRRSVPEPTFPITRLPGLILIVLVTSRCTSIATSSAPGFLYLSPGSTYTYLLEELNGDLSCAQWGCLRPSRNSRNSSTGPGRRTDWHHPARKIGSNPFVGSSRNHLESCFLGHRKYF